MQAVPLVIPAPFDAAPIEDRLSELQLGLNQKANASTVGGLSTALNSKASAADLSALAGTVAGKADADALADKASQASVDSLSASVASTASAMSGKADATVVAALSSTVGGKASAAALSALAATVPTIATDAPLPEANTPAAGVDGMKVPGAKHVHQRLSSTTGNQPAHVIGANGTATIAFTQAFTDFPGTVFTEVPPLTGAMPSQPADFRVESWIRETMSPVPAGKYTGCVVRAWRARPLPLMNLLTGLLNLTGVNGIITALTGFDVFGASSAGTAFTCTAIKRSDT